MTGFNITKEDDGVYPEKYKMLLKKPADTNKWSWLGGLNIVIMTVLTK